MRKNLIYEFAWFNGQRKVLALAIIFKSFFALFFREYMSSFFSPFFDH